MFVIRVFAALLAFTPAITFASEACKRCSFHVADRSARCESMEFEARKELCRFELVSSEKSCDDLCGGKRIAVSPGAAAATARSSTLPERELIPANATAEQVRDRMTERCHARGNPFVDCACIGESVEREMLKAPIQRPASYHQNVSMEAYCIHKNAAVLSASLMKQCESTPLPTFVNKQAFCACMSEFKTRKVIANSNMARGSKLHTEALAACQYGDAK